MKAGFQQVSLNLKMNIAGWVVIILCFCSITARAEVAKHGQISRTHKSSLLEKKNLLELQNQCLISVGQLKNLSGRIDYIVSNDREVRYAYGFKRVLAIPLDQIKLKHFLKPDTLVLLPKGIELYEYLQTCGELHKAGYSRVFVLKDGLMAVSALNKTSSAPVNYKLISPEEFFIERHERHWIVVSLGNINLEELRHGLPYGAQFVTLKQLHGALHRLKKTKLPTGIIVVDRNGGRANDFYQIARRYSRSDLFYLRRGINGLKRYVQLQHLISGKHEFVLQKPRGCGL